MKPPILTKHEIDLLQVHPVNNLWNYKAWIEVGCKAQRDADLKWFVKWGDRMCTEHVVMDVPIEIGGGTYKKADRRRRRCRECWQELQN